MPAACAASTAGRSTRINTIANSTMARDRAVAPRRRGRCDRMAVRRQTGPSCCEAPNRIFDDDNRTDVLSSRVSEMTPYAELHCHSNFSFLDGASAPDELVERAVELGLPALGVTDHQGLYGVVRFACAAEEAGLQPVIGCEIELT